MNESKKEAITLKEELCGLLIGIKECKKKDKELRRLIPNETNELTRLRLKKERCLNSKKIKESKKRVKQIRSTLTELRVIRTKRVKEYLFKED